MADQKRSIFIYNEDLRRHRHGTVAGFHSSTILHSVGNQTVTGYAIQRPKQQSQFGCHIQYRRTSRLICLGKLQSIFREVPRSRPRSRQRIPDLLQYDPSQLPESFLYNFRSQLFHLWITIQWAQLLRSCLSGHR